MEISAGLGRQTPTGSSPLLPLMIPNWLVSRATSTLFSPTTWLRLASTTSGSSDRGNSWARPVKVNHDKGTHFFPWIAAGTTGRVDFIWLSTPDLSPSDAALSPWTAIFGQTTNGTSGTPSFSQTSASNKVMHVGGICTDGIFCSVSGGNRDLADSISITIDRGGSAALVWTDQGSVLNGPTHITYGCIIAGQSALAGAKRDLSCKGPAGP